MRSSNPALSDKTFQGFSTPRPGEVADRMTVLGTVQKSFVLIVLVKATATWSWGQAFPDGWSTETIPRIPVWYYPAIMASFIVALVVIFKNRTAPWLAPVYAVLQGATQGGSNDSFGTFHFGVCRSLFCFVRDLECCVGRRSCDVSH